MILFSASILRFWHQANFFSDIDMEAMEEKMLQWLYISGKISIDITTPKISVVISIEF